MPLCPYVCYVCYANLYLALMYTIDVIVTKSIGEWLPDDYPTLMNEDSGFQPPTPRMSLHVYRAANSPLFELRKESSALPAIGRYKAYPARYLYPVTFRAGS